MRTELDSLVATAQASIRVTERILVALADYPQGEAEATWEAVLRGDTQLTVDFEAGTMTLHVAGKPLFTCPATDHYGPTIPKYWQGLLRMRWPSVTVTLCRPSVGVGPRGGGYPS
jgi:hypothetical protein